MSAVSITVSATVRRYLVRDDLVVVTCTDGDPLWSEASYVDLRAMAENQLGPLTDARWRRVRPAVLAQVRPYVEAEYVPGR